jgi:hypothetical protein
MSDHDDDSDAEPTMVDCGVHGMRRATVVCRHLLRRTDAIVGFIENSSDPHDLQAWCDACEDVPPRTGAALSTELATALRRVAQLAIISV